ncbi:MAG TPA: hypothetical protein VL523_08970 [Terriglobia bacterium]|nr:hypothetical protein [Terriglobia bacterium]
MPKYKVLRPIEHNQTLYLPKDASAPSKAKSAGHGQEIQVDVSGTIELDSEQAQILVHGQTALVSESSGAGAGRKQARHQPVRDAAEVR